ncbi:type II secretion system protein [Ramlibacter tataouinensis]|uniref:Pseudopilin, general secretion pathway protein G-like protein n=1 Tax=Ramlibacter tataouinensis (strain ATCC BAA-407 / DSM 14655 / LMG 21543 / TTB310) TaxID=365046 RepID=F5Y2I0_RAMTT|nr:type II secretion system protein [Ramlibacter tataouinensis]AEG92343.1 pseudopilin, general secretion pathway protein G precursor-like protein [Ramlibacter tataouinensis TTB310]
MSANKRKCGAGFTLIELLVTLALVGVAAAIVLPLASLAETRAKEAELRQALRNIRQALDEYKAAADAGVIDKPTGTSGYPTSLEVLVTGVPRSAALGASEMPLVFLRRIPRDPFFADNSTPAAQTWRIRSYGAAPGESNAGQDVFDVSSKSNRTALDGTRISEW